MGNRIRNIYFSLTFAAFFANSLFAAIFGVFLKERGISNSQIAALNLILLAAWTVFEVPTGLFADRCGRKYSFVAACLVSALSMFIYSSATGFITFLIADLIAALGCALSSGAFEAWAVDSSIHADGHCDAGKLAGKAAIFQMGARIAGATVGSQLGEFGLYLPFALAGVLMVALALAAAFLIDEPYRATFSDIFPARSPLMAWLRSAVTQIFTLRWLAAIGALGFVLSFASHGVNTYWNIELSDRGVSASGIGYAYSALVAATAGCIWLHGLLTLKVKHQSLVLVVPLMMFCAGLFGMGLSTGPFTLIAFLMLNDCGRAVTSLFSSQYLNERATSGNRATIISFYSMAENCGGMVGLTFVLLALTSQRIPTLWLWLGFGATVSAVALLTLLFSGPEKVLPSGAHDNARPPAGLRG